MKRWRDKMKKISVGALIHEPGSSRNYKTGGWRTLKPVVDKTKCIKCYICYDFCPDGAIKKVEDGIEFDYDYCKGCGICANECPKKAIEMVLEEK
jgi:pyruvate ferredoxin oxidoreductase delta subunit